MARFQFSVAGLTADVARALNTPPDAVQLSDCLIDADAYLGTVLLRGHKRTWTVAARLPCLVTVLPGKGRAHGERPEYFVLHGRL